jgi:sporulation-control protein spo0M
MTNGDKKTFKEARPYVVGVVALLMRLTKVHCDNDAFTNAEKFVQEFERVNEIGG